MSFATMMCFIALGCFDTAKAQSFTVSPASLVFTAAQGGNPPNTQTVSVMSTGGNINYTILPSVTSGTNWLFASTGPFNGNGGTAPDQLTVQVNSTLLQSGNYSGTITLTPTSTGGTPTVINVTLNVTGSVTTTFISATPSQLSFGYELSKEAPPSQTSQIVSSGISLPLSSPLGLVYGNCSTGWFQASLSTNATPAVLMVTINTTGLIATTCLGRVTVTSADGTTQTSVGISLLISNSALLNVSVPTGLQSVTAQQGARPVQFNLGVTSSDPSTSVSFTLSTVSSGWLAAAPPCPPSNPCTTQVNSSIIVQVTPGSLLAVGTYNGSITVTELGTNLTTPIPITLTITSSSSISVSPAGTQNFTELQGGALPGPLTLTLTGAANQSAAFTTSVIQGSGGAWLQVSPQSGSLTGTPTTSSGTITLSVAANSLSQGTYSSQAVITFQNSAIPQILISVSLTVQAPASAIVATPAAVSFSYPAGGALPAVQTISITNPASGSIPFTVASVSDSWFSVTPTTGITPQTISVAVSPQSLLPGSYNGSFTLTSPGVANTTITVALFVSASATPQPFIISNAASGVGSQLSPGEIITIKGSGLGPGNPVSFTLSSLSSQTLGGVQVTFSGFSGTLLYVSSTQINVIVPYEIAGSATTVIVVSYQGALSAPIQQPVAAASLGLFTDNSTGSGQAAVVNQNYTYNTPATPAPQGSYISVYATGGGQTTPASIDGEVSPTASLLPLVLQQYVTATIGGKPATVVFAGAAPGYVTGVVQLNIQIPTGVTGSALPIVVTINGPISTQSQAGATVAVQ